MQVKDSKYKESIIFRPDSFTSSSPRIEIVDGELRIHFNNSDSYYKLADWQAEELLLILEPAIEKLEHFLKPKF